MRNLKLAATVTFLLLGVNILTTNAQESQQRLLEVEQIKVKSKGNVVSLDDAMRTAFQNRQELQQSDVQRQINEIDQRFYREQTKPQVDLIASYGVQGLAGSVTSSVNPLTASNSLLRDRVNQLSQLNGLPALPTPPTTGVPNILIGGYPQSFDNLLLNRFNNYRFGVQVSLPIRNRTAEAQLGRSLVDKSRIATQREQIEQQVQVDVRNALQSVKTAQSRLISAAAAREASEQQYASEQRKLDAGQSTVFLVLQQQTALTTARGNELRAQTELNKAAADLQRATGNALEANRVEVSVH